jgi:hypothetical protein
LDFHGVFYYSDRSTGDSIEKFQPILLCYLDKIVDVFI